MWASTLWKGRWFFWQASVESHLEHSLGFPPPEDHLSWKRSSSYSMNKKCRSSPRHDVELAKDVKTENRYCCGSPVVVPSAFQMLYTKLVLIGKVSLLGPLMRTLVSVLLDHW